MEHLSALRRRCGQRVATTNIDHSVVALLAIPRDPVQPTRVAVSSHRVLCTTKCQAARAKIVALLAQLVQKGALSLPPSIMLPDDSRIKTMGTRIEERIDEMDKKLDLLLKKVEDLQSKIS